MDDITGGVSGASYGSLKLSYKVEASYFLVSCSDYLRFFVRHFLVESVMQLFSRNSDMLIPNLPHAKLYFQVSLSKLQYKMAAKITDKVSIIMIIHHAWVHSGHTNLTFVFKITFLF